MQDASCTGSELKAFNQSKNLSRKQLRSKSPSSYSCSTCGSWPGEPCVDKRANKPLPLAHYHLARRLLVKRQNVELEGYYTLQTVALKLHQHRDTIRSWIRKGIFTAYKPAPNKSYISQEQVNRFIAAKTKARYRENKQKREQP